MRVLVLIEAHAAVVGPEPDRILREAVGPRLEQLMQTGKVAEAGFLTDRQGGFFLLDIDAAEGLYALLGPEVYGHFRVQASPVAPAGGWRRALRRVGPGRAVGGRSKGGIHGHTLAGHRRHRRPGCGSLHVSGRLPQAL